MKGYIFTQYHRNEEIQGELAAAQQKKISLSAEEEIQGELGNFQSTKQHNLMQRVEIHTLNS